MPEEIPRPVIDAVLEYVNVGQSVDIKQLVRSQQKYLLTSAADLFLEKLIAQDRDDPESVSYLRSRWHLLMRCRERGIDEAFSDAMDDGISQVVLEFVNTRDTAELLKYVEAHSKELLSDDAEAVLRAMSDQYRDDEAIQAFLSERIELLRKCRRKGVAKAFSRAIMTIPEPLGIAVAAFMTADSVSAQQRALTEQRTLLLTDEAEDLIAFIAEGIATSNDPKGKDIRARLALLRRCRTEGLERVFDSKAPEALLGSLGGMAQAATTPAVDLDAQLTSELGPIVDSDGHVSEEGLRDLMRRRPELVGPFRTLMGRGSVLWNPSPERNEIRAMMQEVAAAEATGNWSRVIEAGTQALRAASYDIDPRAAAMVHTSVGTALSRTPSGDRAENLDRAIEHHLEARQIFEQYTGNEVEDAVWAMNEHDLGLAWFQRVRGHRADNIEEAIRIWRKLVAAKELKARPLEWEVSLADAIRSYPRGNRDENMEESIQLAGDVLRRAEEVGNGYARSRASIILGLAYLDRVAGDGADNVEQAIAHLSRGLAGVDPVSDTTGWANTQRSLAMAYERRTFGRPTDNWRAAEERLRLILEKCPKESFPEQWAETQLGLAALKLNHPEGCTHVRAMEAIQSTEAALEIYTLKDFPARWAKVHANLGSIFTSLFAASNDPQDDYFAKAITHIENAFRVYTREAAPDRWGLLHLSLGKIYLHRAELSYESARWEVAERAIEHFERVLEVRTAENDPEGRLETLRSLIAILFRNQNWERTLELCVEGMRAADKLLEAAHTEAGKLFNVSISDWIYGPASLSLLRMNDPVASLICLEWGKSRMLVQALAARDLDLVNLPESQAQEIRALRGRIRRLEAEFRQQHELQQPLAELGHSLADARVSLTNTIEAVTDGHPGLMRSRLRPEEIYALARAPGAVIVPLITEEGSAVFAAIKDEQGQDHFIHVSIDWLKRTHISGLLAGTEEDPGWMRKYRDWRAGTGSLGAWRGSIQPVLATLWKFLLEPVVEALEKRLPVGSHITIVPQGELSFFPFHAAGDDGAGTCILDRFAVAYAPSLYTLLASQRRLEAMSSGSVRLMAVVNPTSDLEFADAEGDAVEGWFSDDARAVFREGEATVAKVIKAIGCSTHLHFACHGDYDGSDVMHSGLVLADGTMSLASILGPEVDLSHARLVTLSACETGLIDTKCSPGEFIGLTAAFLQGGASGVLSTLWPVEDRAANLLMYRFYESHLGSHLSPAAALRNAQLWLRDASRETIGSYYLAMKLQTEETYAAFVDVTLTGSPEERPYQDPYYWAAFQYTGA